MWQIGVLTWKLCTFWPSWGSFSVSSHTTRNPVYALNSNRKPLLHASRQVEGMCHFTSEPTKVSPYFCSAKNAENEPFWTKKCTVSLWERQFATLYLFHAYTPPPPQIPQFAADTLETPPTPGIFSKKSKATPSPRLGLPLPSSPEQKIKKIRNVHQVLEIQGRKSVKAFSPNCHVFHPRQRDNFARISHSGIMINKNSLA